MADDTQTENEEKAGTNSTVSWKIAEYALKDNRDYVYPDGADIPLYKTIEAVKQCMMGPLTHNCTYCPLIFDRMSNPGIQPYPCIKLRKAIFYYLKQYQEILDMIDFKLDQEVKNR